MLSIKDRAMFIAKLAEGKEDEAKAIVNFWESDKKAVFPEVNIGQRKIKEEEAQLKKLKGE